MVKTRASAWSVLVKTDDWLSIWVGFLILAVFLAGLTIRLPDWKWMSGGEFAGRASAWSDSLEALRRDAARTGEEALRGPADALLAALGAGDRNLARAAGRELEKAAAAVSPNELQARAAKLAGEIGAATGQSVARVLSWNNLKSVLPVFAFLLLAGFACSTLIGRNPARFAAGFPVLFIISLLGFFIAGNATLSYYGIEYVFWALFVGLLISNTVGVPAWLKAAANTELYIKVGLVLLGAEMLFGTLLKAGAWGMVQAVLVIVAVWYFCYWLAGKLGLDEEFGAILATGVSVCGVSAAIAAGGALKGDPKKVSHTISLVLIVAIPMLILQPIIARLLHLPEAVTGAWIGGTIDTTGAVVAAGSIAGQRAMDLAVVVKMAQNSLIGLVAFLLALWSAVRRKTGAERPAVGEVWRRFPKFVLGFFFASLVFSLLIPEATARSVSKISAGLRGYWFCLAFLSIGLETRLKELLTMKGGRPAISFLGAQVFNIFWTLLIAGLLFGGLLFAAPRF